MSIFKSSSSKKTTNQRFTAPGVSDNSFTPTFVEVLAVGGGGGNGGSDGGSGGQAGGAGGLVISWVPDILIPGTVYTVAVGGNGSVGDQGHGNRSDPWTAVDQTAYGGAGGFNGGGHGGPPGAVGTSGGGGGGGGWSGFYNANTSTYYVVSGGGYGGGGAKEGYANKKRSTGANSFSGSGIGSGGDGSGYGSWIGDNGLDGGGYGAGGGGWSGGSGAQDYGTWPEERPASGGGYLGNGGGAVMQYKFPNATNGSPYEAGYSLSSAPVYSWDGWDGGGTYGAANVAGCVVIRYPGGQRATGGTITSVAGYTVHTYTGAGLYTFIPT